MEILIERGQPRATMARPFSILIPGQCGNMFWQNLSDAFCLFLSPCFLQCSIPSDLLPVASWSVRSLMKCRFSWESLQFGPIIFPHPPFNAPFTILFFARDVPFAQRIIHCIRDWSPKRRLSKTFELLYGLEKTRKTALETASKRMDDVTCLTDR